MPDEETGAQLPIEARYTTYYIRSPVELLS